MSEQHSNRWPTRRGSLRIIVAFVVAISVLLGKDFSLDARQAVFGQKQIQLYVPYSGAQPILLPPVLLIAHNAGNQEDTARRALGHSAAGIEIDIRMVDGQLFATHSAPSNLLPLRAYQAPRFRDAWSYVGDASVVKLDLKSTNQRTLDLLVTFIEAHPGDRQVMTVSSNQDALVYLDDALPESIQLLSVSSSIELTSLLEEGDRPAGIDGISVPEWVLTADRIEELKERGYVIDAWTVNDVERLVELTSLGVDSITTDNLAFFDMAVEELDPANSNTGRTV